MLFALVLLLGISFRFALSCPEVCECNLSTWTVHSYFKPEDVNNVPTAECSNKQLQIVPNPIGDEIVILRLHDNNIRDIEIVGNLNKLLVLTLNNNQIRQVILFEAKNIQYLHLKGNRLKRIPVTSSSVQYLNLNDNLIDADPEKNLKTYDRLKRVDMKNNSLNYLPFLPSTLIEGYFNQNKIKFVTREVLNGAPYLKNLYLNDNQIYQIDFPEAIYLSRLGKLGLSNNPYLEMEPVIKKWCEIERSKSDICRKAKSITIRTCI